MREIIFYRAGIYGTREMGMGDNSACCYTYSNGYSRKGTKKAPFPPSLLSGEHKYRYIYALLEKLTLRFVRGPRLVGLVGNMSKSCVGLRKNGNTFAVCTVRLFGYWI